MKKTIKVLSVIMAVILAIGLTTVDGNAKIKSYTADGNYNHPKVTLTGKIKFVYYDWNGFDWGAIILKLDKPIKINGIKRNKIDVFGAEDCPVEKYKNKKVKIKGKLWDIASTSSYTGYGIVPQSIKKISKKKS